MHNQFSNLLSNRELQVFKQMLGGEVTPNLNSYGSLLRAASLAGDKKSLRKVGVDFQITSQAVFSAETAPTFRNYFVVLQIPL